MRNTQFETGGGDHTCIASRFLFAMFAMNKLIRSSNYLAYAQVVTTWCCATRRHCRQLWREWSVLRRAEEDSEKFMRMLIIHFSWYLTLVTTKPQILSGRSHESSAPYFAHWTWPNPTIVEMCYYSGVVTCCWWVRRRAHQTAGGGRSLVGSGPGRSSCPAGGGAGRCGPSSSPSSRWPSLWGIRGRGSMSGEHHKAKPRLLSCWNYTRCFSKINSPTKKKEGDFWLM